MKIEMNGKEYTPNELVATLEATSGVDAPAPAPDRSADSMASVEDSPSAVTFQPTAGQQAAADAVAALMRRPGPQLATIVGYAGVGKTTMLRIFGEQYRSPRVITPTGKAALRVTQASGLPASTVHRWIYKPEVDPKSGKLKFSKRLTDLELPPSKLVLIDEASMISADIWADIWRVAQAYDLKVVAIGDGFQLPPVQEKNAPAFSLLDPALVQKLSGVRVELTEVLRQAMDSPVVRASMRLREGMGVRALAELPRIERDNLGAMALAAFRAGGVIISNTNDTRFRVNYAMRDALHPGQYGPQPGEPLLILRNNYEFGAYNGEQLTFEGWTVPPDQPMHVHDRYTNAEADVYFGEAKIDGRAAIIAIEQLHGSTKDIGGYALATAGELWARQHGCYTEDDCPTPFVEANFGYCYTAHKSQGSEWPCALVMVEPRVRLDEEDGRRWAYTAITRAKTSAAIFYGRI